MDHTRHCLVLRDTSVWLLVLAYGILSAAPYRASLIVVACSLSVLHWNKYASDGPRRQWDMVAAQAYAVTDVLVGAAPLRLKLLLYVLALLAYVQACAHKVGSRQGLIHHVFFRYCMFTVGFGPSVPPLTYVVVSAAYVCHCCFLLFIPVPAWYLPHKPEVGEMVDGQIIAFLC